MIWAAVYIWIGIAIGMKATVKGGGKPAFSSYVFCVVAWPLILAIVIAGYFKKGGRRS